MKNLWVFDLDDTLMDNVHDYAEPILNGIKIIVRALGSKAPHVSRIMEIEQEIDKKRRDEINPLTGKKFGYSMERFPGSQVETYRFLCQKTGVAPDHNVEMALWETGMQAFSEDRYAQNIHPHAIEVLAFLSFKEDISKILTAGDERVQARKISALKAAGMNKLTNVKIVARKTPLDFSEMAKGFEGWKLITVGNKYESDIQPALEAGYHRGIYIPMETWETLGRMQEIEAQVDKSKCLIFKDLSEIRTRYKEV